MGREQSWMVVVGEGEVSINIFVAEQKVAEAA